MSVKIITLDCPPGSHRPNDALKDVLQDTPFTIEDFILLSCVFGQWSFQLSSNKLETFEIHKNDIITNIKKLYNSSRIRYAEWEFDE